MKLLLIVGFALGLAFGTVSCTNAPAATLDIYSQARNQPAFPEIPYQKPSPMPVAAMHRKAKSSEIISSNVHENSRYTATADHVALAGADLP
jgi:hypothetical protein